MIQDDKNWITLNGYAFIDNWGFCIIIVYGEKKRDLLSEYLSMLL